MTSILSSLLRFARKHLRIPKRQAGFSSDAYWKERYSSGGNSGPGSYAHLARFKADVLNTFVREHDVDSVIEFGCGDGNQLRYADYTRYTGYDVSADAVAACEMLFPDDESKSFRLVEDYDGRKADLSISLDVIFHLVEDDVFDAYMRRLFDAAIRFVAIYSSNFDSAGAGPAAHVRHRKFTDWVATNRSDWAILDVVRNEYPYDGDYHSTTFSDFYIFERGVSEPRSI